MSHQLDGLARAIGHSRPLYDHDGRIAQRWRNSSAELLNDAFFSACEILNIGTLIECGAHAAEASVRFMQVAGRNAIAVEANPYTFDAKTSAAQASGVDARNVGLGAVPGVAELHIPSPGFSKTPGSASFLRREDDYEYESVTVVVTTLDEVAAEVGPSEWLALWVDVEGLTAEVLSGGAGLLSGNSCKVIKVEVESCAAWEGQLLGDEVDSLLSGFGFTPLMRDAEYEGQYNLIYVKHENSSAIDEVVIAFWSGLSTLKLPEMSRRHRSVRAWLGDAKANLVARDPRFGGVVHRLAALLGSASSQDRISGTG